MARSMAPPVSLLKCRLVLDEKLRAAKKGSAASLKLYGQENEAGTWAMANINMIIHDMEGEIQIGDTFRKPKFRQGNRSRPLTASSQTLCGIRLSSRRSGLTS